MGPYPWPTAPPPVAVMDGPLRILMIHHLGIFRTIPEEKRRIRRLLKDDDETDGLATVSSSLIPPISSRLELVPTVTFKAL